MNQNRVLLAAAALQFRIPNVCKFVWGKTIFVPKMYNRNMPSNSWHNSSPLRLHRNSLLIYKLQFTMTGTRL